MNNGSTSAGRRSSPSSAARRPNNESSTSSTTSETLRHSFRPRKRKAREAGLDNTTHTQDDSVDLNNISAPSSSPEDSSGRRGSRLPRLNVNCTDGRKEKGDNDDAEATSSTSKEKQGKNSRSCLKKGNTDDDEEEDANECIICMEPMKEETSLDSCKHVFCYDCIKKWSKTENTCPLCKVRFHKMSVKNPKGTTPTGRRKRQKTERVTDRNQRYGPNFADFLNDMAALDDSMEMFMGMGMMHMGLFRELGASRNRRGNRGVNNNSDNSNDINGRVLGSGGVVFRRRGVPSNSDNPTVPENPFELFQLLLGSDADQVISLLPPTPPEVTRNPRRLQGTREFAMRHNPIPPQPEPALRRNFRPSSATTSSSSSLRPSLSAQTRSSIPFVSPQTPMQSGSAPIAIDLQQEIPPPIHIPPMERLVSFSNSLINDRRVSNVALSRPSLSPPVIEIIDDDDQDNEGIEIISVVQPRSHTP